MAEARTLGEQQALVLPQLVWPKARVEALLDEQISRGMALMAPVAMLEGEEVHLRRIMEWFTLAQQLLNGAFAARKVEGTYRGREVYRANDLLFEFQRAFLRPDQEARAHWRDPLRDPTIAERARFAREGVGCGVTLLESIRQRLSPEEAQSEAGEKPEPRGAAAAALHGDKGHRRRPSAVGEGGRARAASRRPRDNTQARVRDQVFVSYSHRDRMWLEQLQTHLAPHVRGGITVWDDTKIASGSKWRENIESALGSARVAVLLVSPPFLASEFIQEQEMPRILHAAEEDGLIILWIPVRESAYFDTWIADYQAAHDPKKPLAGLRPAARDKALVEIALKIRRAAKQGAAER